MRGRSNSASLLLDHRRTFRALRISPKTSFGRFTELLWEVDRVVLLGASSSSRAATKPVLHPRPRHVALIMDGNGRWAEQRGLPRVMGHRQGARAVRAVTRKARELGLEALTLYAFSQQNWQRPVKEVRSLWRLLERYARNEEAELVRNGIRLVVIGDEARLPPGLRHRLARLEHATRASGNMVLCLALSYGGQEAITKAAERIAIAAHAGALEPRAVNVQSFASQLETASLPPVDLIIRTSGERRLSNFLLWEAAYAELYFSDKLWPDFTGTDLEGALDDFSRRERRFGNVRALQS